MLLSFYPVDYAFLILLGLGSSLHCAGMCGPIACSYALPLASQKPSLLWSYHLRYTLGRLLVYGWFGALMGAIGIGFGQMLSKTESLRELAGWLAASVLVLGGLAGFFNLNPFVRTGSLLAGGASGLARPFMELGRNLGSWRALPLGMVSGILPCGMMWAVELRALATNSILWGTVTMLVFCLATTPSLLLTGELLARLSARLRKRVSRIAGLMVTAMGLLLMLRLTGGILEPGNPVGEILGICKPLLE